MILTKQQKNGIIIVLYSKRGEKSVGRNLQGTTGFPVEMSNLRHQVPEDSRRLCLGDYKLALCARNAGHAEGQQEVQEELAEGRCKIHCGRAHPACYVSVLGSGQGIAVPVQVSGLGLRCRKLRYGLIKEER